jgi:hypothetical protein
MICDEPALRRALQSCAVRDSTHSDRIGRSDWDESMKKRVYRALRLALAVET